MIDNNDNTDLFFDVHQVSRLLHINEKKIYALAGQGKLPATKVTGKWLFPKRDLESYIEEQATQTLRKFSSEYALHKNVLLVAGSDDPLMYLIQGMLHSRHPEFVLFSASLGSGEGMRLLKEGYCHIALSHLYDQQAGEYNFPFINKLFENPDDIVVVNLFHRSVGFVSRGDPVRTFRDIAERDMRFVNRQKRSGIHHRIETLIDAEGVDRALIKGFDDEVYTHIDVAAAVMSGNADTGIAAESVARFPDLAFHQLFEERFDMLIRKSVFFKRYVQVFIEFVRSPDFFNMLKGMRGYNTRETGHVLYPRDINRESGEPGYRKEFNQT
jgi:excisionase family DNA binding protein